jgi:hypothetical protein
VFLRFDSQWGLGIFLFTITSRIALGLTQPPIQWIPGGLSLGVEWPGCEADHSPPSSSKVKECVELYLHFPNTLSWCGAQLKKKHRGNFTLNLSDSTKGSIFGMSCKVCHTVLENKN